MADSIEVEVAYAEADKHVLLSLSVPVNTTVQQAIQLSGITETFPELDLTTMVVGIFGQICDAEKRVLMGDRVEIYRPLMQNPMQARRNRMRS